jgi:hypothetical protein
VLGLQSESEGLALWGRLENPERSFERENLKTDKRKLPNRVEACTSIQGVKKPRRANEEG